MQSTLDDKKKEILYAMYGGLDFYVFSETLQHPVRLMREAKRVSALIKQPAIARQIATAIAKHRAFAESQLIEASRL
jgi:hypothetical protein